MGNGGGCGEIFDGATWSVDMAASVLVGTLQVHIVLLRLLEIISEPGHHSEEECTTIVSTELDVIVLALTRRSVMNISIPGKSSRF